MSGGRGGPRGFGGRGGGSRFGGGGGFGGDRKYDFSGKTNSSLNTSFCESCRPCKSHVSLNLPKLFYIAKACAGEDTLDLSADAVAIFVDYTARSLSWITIFRCVRKIFLGSLLSDLLPQLALTDCFAALYSRRKITEGSHSNSS